MLDMASPYNRLLPAEDIMRLQILRNAELEKAHTESKLKYLTLRRAIEEASEALRWLLEEFMHGAQPLSSLAEGTRLRGLGILCIAAAVVLIAVDTLIVD